MSHKILATRRKVRQHELVVIGKRVVEKMESNPVFPKPPSSLAELKKVLPEFQAALVNAKGRDKEMVAIKNNKRAIVLKLLDELADYVTITCKGDLTLLLGSGFDITSESAAALPPAIEILDVELGDPGEATTRIKKITGAIAFVHEYTTEPPGPNTIWISRGSSLSTYTFKGLTSDKRHWFRVIAIGRGGQLGFSPIVTRVIQ